MSATRFARPEVSPALRRLLADPRQVPRAAGPEAHVAALWHAHAAALVAAALTRAGVEALLVKGGALALTVYPEPAARPMSDLDLLVREADRSRVVAALAAAGCEERRPPGRRHSAPLLGETVLLLRAGAMTELVEVHTTLDKVAARPVDTGAIFARSAPAPGLPGLRVPGPEDHALLIALHAAGHGFAHPVAFLDLELLLRRGLDVPALAARARAFALTTVMFVMLETMRDLGAASVGPEILAAFDPGPLRRAMLGALPAGSATAEPGIGWVLGQAPLRDDPAQWLSGLGRYALARVRDRTSPLAPSTADMQDPAVPYRVPLWVRALLSTDRLAARLENARAGLRDEALLAWTTPGDRAGLTASLYADQSTYLPGGHRFVSGLFSWERRVLEDPAFPRSGRVLVGAAGAGREMAALVERGFEVVAFDPCQPFVEAARKVAPPGKAVALRASYRDLVDAAAGRGGPLAEACAGPPFAAVVLGWGSLSHVMPRSERAALLRAVHAIAPQAPVLTSFVLEPEASTPRSGKGRVRESLRSLFAALGAPGTSEDGDHFFPHIGFFSYLASDELATLARDAGYEVALFEEGPYPHALLQPRSTGASPLPG